MGMILDILKFQLLWELLFGRGRTYNIITNIIIILSSNPSYYTVWLPY